MIDMAVDPNDVMGIGDRLLKQHPDMFTDEFEQNKDAVQKLTEVGFVHLQNRIAGYITRQVQSS